MNKNIGISKDLSTEFGEVCLTTIFKFTQGNGFIFDQDIIEMFESRKEINIANLQELQLKRNALKLKERKTPLEK